MTNELPATDPPVDQNEVQQYTGGDVVPVAEAHPFGVTVPAASNAAAATDQARGVAQVQAAMLLARRFPRDQAAAYNRVVNAFTRTSLAEAAAYEYGKGGTAVTGPTIRAAEAIAQQWGNIHCAVEELEQRDGASTVRVFALDAESGFMDEKTFQVKHWRDTKRGGYPITDQREIYELVANMGARRKRACLLAVIPGDVVEAAIRQAEITLHTKAEITPERLVEMLKKFAEFGIDKSHIEKRIQRSLESMSPAQLLGLGKIFNSIKDGMSVASDWFDIAPPAVASVTSMPAALAPTSKAEAVAAQLKARGTVKGKGDAAATPSVGPATVDKETGEVKGMPDVTEDKVREDLERATNIDTLDTVATLIDAVPGDKAKDRLLGVYKARGEALRGAM